jgi:GntR family transcriptional repressor for pyruvate dehydrogenase complex
MNTNEPPLAPADRDAALGSVMQFLELQAGKRHGRLPPERELAATLNLSRARLRVCLKVLEERGLIWRHVGMGTFFGARPANLGGPLSSLAERTNPQEVMEARLAIEPELARMATMRARQSDLDEMERCLEEMRHTENTAQWLALDTRLHRAISRAAGNALMSALLETAQDHRDKELWTRLRDAILTPDRIKVLNEQHAAVVAAIRDRDPSLAAQAMRQHIRSVRDRTLGDA